MASFLRSLSSSSSSKLALGAAAAAAAAAAGYALSRASTGTASCAAAKAAAKRLDPNAFVPFTLASKEKITHDTYRLLFHHDDSVTYAEALPPASCLLARLPTGKAKEDGTPAYFMRPYTATNLPADRGTIELVVKDYEGGKMSSALCALKPGQVCEMKGPIPKVREGCCSLPSPPSPCFLLLSLSPSRPPFEKKRRPLSFPSLKNRSRSPRTSGSTSAASQVAPGSRRCTSESFKGKKEREKEMGKKNSTSTSTFSLSFLFFRPSLSLSLSLAHASENTNQKNMKTPQISNLRCIVTSFADPADTTKYSLVYGSRSSSDIILKKELDELARAHPGRLELTYLVDKGPLPDGKGHVGFVTGPLLKSALPKPSSDSMVFVCGPPPLVNLVSGPKAKDKTQGELVGLLKELGYKAENVFKF